MTVRNTVRRSASHRNARNFVLSVPARVAGNPGKRSKDMAVKVSRAEEAIYDRAMAFNDKRNGWTADHTRELEYLREIEWRGAPSPSVITGVRT
jgi:hypothetical protein